MRSRQLWIGLVVALGLGLWRLNTLSEPDNTHSATAQAAPAPVSGGRSASAGEAPADVEEGFVISGVVTAESGPLGSVQVVWEPPPTAFGEVIPPEKWVEHPVAADGTFSFTVPGPGIVRTEPVSHPAKDIVQRPTASLAFQFPQECPVTVLVEGPDGAPTAGVALDVSALAGELPDVLGPSVDDVAVPLGRRETDGRGRLRLDDAPCGIVRLAASEPPYVPEKHTVDSFVEKEATVRLRAGVWVHGVISDEQAPIEGAIYTASADGIRYPHQKTGADGYYEFTVAPGSELNMYANLDGFLPADLSLHVPEDAEEIEQDVLLDEARRVTLRCPGLPDDSCDGLYPITCGVSAEREPHPCTAEGVCDCPFGDVIVTAGSRSAGVAADESVAVIDYRDTASMTAVIMAADGPAACSAIIGDMHGSCDSDGVLTVLGLSQGTYRLSLFVDDRLESVDGVEIEAGENDIGTIKVGGSSSVEGVLVDAETDEGLAGVEVHLFCRSGEEVGSASTRTRSGGEFSFSGLLGGRCMASVMGELEVSMDYFSVPQGETTEIKLTATPREKQPVLDFDTRTTEDGRFLVTNVTEGGVAEEAGLQAGDILVSFGRRGEDGAFVMEPWTGFAYGFDLSADELLVVERDGAEVELHGLE